MPELTQRVGNLERDMHSVMEMLGGMRLSLERIEATLPHLTTKAEVNDVKASIEKRPARTEMWALIGILVAGILAAITIGISLK
ncbi:MAG: hypothetical protein VR70_06000 [Rhodospirillaceae bacterium BRH_c57]|nr:MAG: hypothetical protein VR70_06000 [Rhodospirillaceae bacterium BRH_c57]